MRRASVVAAYGISRRHPQRLSDAARDLLTGIIKETDTVGSTARFGERTRRWNHSIGQNRQKAAAMHAQRRAAPRGSYCGTAGDLGHAVGACHRSSIGPNHSYNFETLKIAGVVNALRTSCSRSSTFARPPFWTLNLPISLSFTQTPVPPRSLPVNSGCASVHSDLTPASLPSRWI